jgi:hypothetical protein
MIWLCRKLAQTRSTSSSAVNWWPLEFCLHRHQVSVNCLHHAWMVLSVGGSFAYFAWNARCTVTTDLLVWYSNTQNDFSPRAAISSLHTFASPSGRNVNYDEKQYLGKNFFCWSFYVYRFRKCLSYGFPIISFCNPRVHYGTPCIFNVFSGSTMILNTREWILEYMFQRKRKLILIINRGFSKTVIALIFW